MLNFETSIQEKKSYNDLTISEVEPIIKINLRSRKRFHYNWSRHGWNFNSRRFTNGLDSKQKEI